MEQFAKLLCAEGEHGEIEGMDDTSLHELVGQIAFEHPDVFIAFLQALEMTAETFFAWEESEQPS